MAKTEQFQAVLTLISDDDRIYELGKPNLLGFRKMRFHSPTGREDGGRVKFLGSDPDPEQHLPRTKDLILHNRAFFWCGHWPLKGWIYITRPIETIR